MSDESGDIIDRDEQILAQRVSGISPRKIARQFGMTLAEVEAVVGRLLPAMSAELRERLFRVDLQRLEELAGAFWDAARGGDAQAAMVVCKVLERRSEMLGFRAPVQIGPIELVQEARPAPSSTELIRRALDRLAGKADPPG